MNLFTFQSQNQKQTFPSHIHIHLPIILVTQPQCQYQSWSGGSKRNIVWVIYKWSNAVRNWNSLEMKCVQTCSSSSEVTEQAEDRLALYRVW